MAGIGDYDEKEAGERGYKMKGFSGFGEGTDSPLKVYQQLAMAAAGSMLEHGSKQSEAKMRAADTKAKSTQFETPRGGSNQAAKQDLPTFTGE